MEIEIRLLKMKIEPNKKYSYSEKFEFQLRRALQGHAPWKDEKWLYIQKALKKKKQIEQPELKPQG